MKNILTCNVPPTDFPVEETLKGCVLDMEDDLNLQCFTSGCLFNRGYSSKERELVLYSITYLYRLHDIRDVKLESLHGLGLWIPFGKKSENNGFTMRKKNVFSLKIYAIIALPDTIMLEFSHTLYILKPTMNLQKCAFSKLANGFHVFTV